MPDFPEDSKGFRMKGWSAFTKKIDPVKKPVGPVTGLTMSEYQKRQVWNLVEQKERKQKPVESIPNLVPNLKQKHNSPLKQKPKDDDSESK